MSRGREEMKGRMIWAKAMREEGEMNSCGNSEVSTGPNKAPCSGNV